MKGPQLATLVWLGNLLVLAGGGMIGYKYYEGIQAEREDLYASINNKTKEERKTWQEQGISENANALRALNPTLSPRPRPRPEVKPTEDKPKPPPVEPTDEELKAEVQKWLADNFTLIRIYGTTAIVTAKEVAGKNLHLYPGDNFKEVFSRPLVEDAYRVLAKYDLTVLSVNFVPGPNALKDHVMFRAPSIKPKYASKYFEVPLMMSPKAYQETMSQTGRELTGNTKKLPLGDRKAGDGDQASNSKPEEDVDPPPPVDTRPKESQYDSKSDTWQLGTDDFANPDVVNEMAKYAKVVQDAQGKPIGIQITDDVPEDSIIVRRGGRRGDIIKSINGHAVTSVGQARSVGRDLYVNQGVTSFEVRYERDGVPGVKKFTLPPRKK